MFRKFETNSYSNQIPQRASTGSKLVQLIRNHLLNLHTGGKHMRPNVLKSLYICEYHVGISGSEQKTFSLSESINKNTSAEK